MVYVFAILAVIFLILFIGQIYDGKIMQDNVEKLKREIQDLNNKIEESQNESIKLKKTNSNLEQEIKQYQKEVSRLNELKEQLEKELIKDDSRNLNVEEDEEEEIVNANATPSSELNKEKSEIFNIMENTNNNMFITGKAGTGKSYLLKYFRRVTKKKVLYCAPTGIAALNIDGVTLHSAFGYDNLKEDAEIKLSANKVVLFKNIDTLVIDEISMVRVDVFNQIDKILRMVSDNNQTFGGKQVIVFGDLFQLPPIASKEEAEYFADKYGGIFFFNSSVYEKGNFIFRELRDIFRQTNKEFIEILNDIRVGNISEKQIASLNKHYTKVVPRRVVQVVPLKNEANRINMENINNLGGQLYNFDAEVLTSEKEIKETDYPCDFNLNLKVGALVMMITNDQEQKRWVNGTLGIISYLSPLMIKVTINGSEYEISPVTFNKYKCVYNRQEGKLEYVVESSVRQYPILLAYAITIHKSQGMTYQQIACNLKSCFAPGQAYVALSRCANYDRLYLTEKIDAKSIITDNVVVNFYRSVKDESND